MLATLFLVVLIFAAIVLTAAGSPWVGLLLGAVGTVATLGVLVLGNQRKRRVTSDVRGDEPAVGQARERTRFAVQQGPSQREDKDWFLYEFTITPTGPGNATRVRASLVYADTSEEVTDERVDVSDYLRAREPRRIRLRVPNDVHERPEEIGRSIVVRVEWEDGDGLREDTFGSPIEVGGSGVRRR
jgi:hypothetical protein